MTQIIRLGSSGPPVLDVQAKLNCIPPSQYPPLAIDGMFGPKTLLRVKEFQSDCELAVDGIVGPITREELDAWITIPGPQRQRCANCNPQNAGHVARVRQSFIAGLRSPAQSLPIRTAEGRSSFVPEDTPPKVALPGGILAAPLSSMQRSVAVARFGSSLDLDCIFLTDQTGAGGRPFTLTIPLTSGMPRFGALSMVVLLNLGTFTPDGNTFVHEMAHAWQAQHHILSVQYMENSVKSQALAIARNAPLGIFDVTVRAHKNFPSLFPFSPYAYEPGKAFGEYCAEQIASQVEDNEGAIVAHVKSVAPGTHDTKNAESLATPRVEDRRKTGVK